MKKQRYLPVWIIFIILTNFFGFYKLLPLGRAIYSLDYIFIMSLAFSLLLVCILLFKNKGKFRKPLFGGTALMLVFISLIEVVYTRLTFQQPIYYAIKESIYYIIPVLVYFVFSQYIGKISFDNIIRIIVSISIAASLSSIILFILYTYLHVNLFNLISVSSDQYRNGTIRFGVGGIVVYPAVVISLTKIFNGERKKSDVINIVLGIIQIIFINKTRSNILYIVMIFLIAQVFNKKSGRMKKILFSVLVLICGLIALIDTNIVSVNINAIINGDLSMSARLEEASFYLMQFVKHPILGMGFVTGDSSVTNWQLVGGYNSAIYYYREDVGYIGYINKFGILGIVWLLLFVKSILGKLKYNTVNTIICKNVLLYFLISSLSLCFMDPQRSMYLFIIMFLVESLMNERRRIA